MRAVWYYFVSSARRQWGSWLALAVVCGLATSLSLAAAGDARRAWSALPRALHSAAGSDLEVHADETAVTPQDAEAYLDRVEHLDAVEFSARSGGVLMAEETDGQIDPRLVFGSALGKVVDDRAVSGIDTFRILSGRLPAPGHPEEIAVNPTVLRITGWRVGDEVPTLRLFRRDDIDENQEPDPTKGTQLDLRIVGEVLRPIELISDAATRTPQIYLFPAFVEAHPDPTYYLSSSIRLKAGKDITAFSNEVTEIANQYENNQLYVYVIGSSVAIAQSALRPQVVAVWLLAAVLFLSGAFIAAQMIGRHLLIRHRDLPELHSLGMTRSQLGLVVMLHAAVVAVLAAIFAALGGLASSALTPFGSTHAVEPHEGLQLDATVIAAGAALVITVLVAGAAIPAWRLVRLATRRSQSVFTDADSPSMFTGFLTRVGARPALMTGARFALHRGRGRTATPVRSVMGGIALATAALTLALAYSSSLDHLVSTPRLYGWDWDVAIKNDFGSIPDDAISAFHDRSEVGAMAGLTIGQLTIDGHVINALGVDEIEGTVYPTLEDGRIALSDQELVLGRRTLADIRHSLGDSVTVETSAGTRPMTIVGIATFPALGQSRTASSLGHGAATVASLFPPDDFKFGGRYNGLLIRVTRELDRTVGIDQLRSYAAELSCTDSCFAVDARPSELSGYAGITNLWIPFVVVLGLLLVISLVHGLVSATRVNRRDLAILAVLGFGRRQITTVVVWQAAIIAAVALAVAIPVGLIAASAGWTIFTRPMGIRPPARVPGMALLAVTAGTITAALVVGVACALSTRRITVTRALVND